MKKERVNKWCVIEKSYLCSVKSYIYGKENIIHQPGDFSICLRKRNVRNGKKSPAVTAGEGF